MANDNPVLEKPELASALERHPITDFAAFGAHLRKQLRDLVLMPRTNTIEKL